jgi:uncharacterized protein YdaU (DUF1376 family)
VNYFNFHIGDYQSHTGHLEPLEDLAYRRMLDWMYLHEKPLPLDTKELAKFIRMRKHLEEIEYILREFFTITDDGWTSQRVMSEIEKYRSKSKKAQASAKARWKGKDANAMRTHTGRNANQEPRTNNQKKKTSRKKFSDDDVAAARYMWQLISMAWPDHKAPNLEAWADDVRLMVERDKRTHREVCELFKFAHHHDFWAKNIRSPAKLRKQWDTLNIEREKNATNRSAQSNAASDVLNDIGAYLGDCDE